MRKERPNPFMTPATRDEIRLLAKQADLDLKPEYFEELVEAYRLAEKMLETVRRGWPLTAEPAHVFAAKTFGAKAP